MNFYDAVNSGFIPFILEAEGRDDLISTRNAKINASIKDFKYIKENGFMNDFSENRYHHEIYLSDPRKTSVDKLKTIIRHPIKKK